MAQTRGCMHIEHEEEATIAGQDGDILFGVGCPAVVETDIQPLRSIRNMLVSLERLIIECIFLLKTYSKLYHSTLWQNHYLSRVPPIGLNGHSCQNVLRKTAHNAEMADDGGSIATEHN